MTQVEMLPDQMLHKAESPETTPFDYVIVGSGAGGGPLASRLASSGRTVLLIEAGVDPAIDNASVGTGGKAPLRDVYAVPAYHAAATEDPDTSWRFSVRHYDSQPRQARDTKYEKSMDPAAVGGGTGKGGIFYPRAAAIGGCTAHHAMIIIRPNDLDWDRLAELTNDPSWRAENMQGYFAKIENCLYYSVYRTFFGRLLGVLYRVYRLVATQLDPRRQLSPNGHGFKGWQMTSFISPLVIAGIVRGDRTFLRLLADVFFAAMAARSERREITRALASLQMLQFLDPNLRSMEFPDRDHLSLMSVGTNGERRWGLREHLLDVAERFPQQLVILNPAHVLRVLFEKEEGRDETPRAIGVEVARGAYLYRASPNAVPGGGPERRQYFARREVILCGGTFNTPQLLMLSGIGDRAHLATYGIRELRDRAGQRVADAVHLPGVGGNLQDRYEVSVISEARQDFATLAGVTFVPGQFSDPALLQWQKDGSGLYSTNGGAIAMMMSSKANAAVRDDPDLFIFGVPAAFRGYYPGWSRELLRRTRGAPVDQRNLWSWSILKAYTSNWHGEVRLRSADPFEPPQVDFHSFDDVPGGAATAAADVEALAEGVDAVRRMNRKITVLADEVQPGPKCPSGSQVLRDWIMDEAWGHHACGSCRMGADAWQADVGKLEDKAAVLDSRFRVHGVKNLRVVDASAFPRIPGYFLVTPTFMLGERAADILLADSENFPRALEEKEARAIRARRIEAKLDPGPDTTTLPDDTIGLALSGGGIRSATFCLGFLQALATRGRLRDIDIVSSVSGGGYAAAFLGRLFTSLSDDVPDKAKWVEGVLGNAASPEIGWLRQNAQYLLGRGRHDTQYNIALVLRNLVSVHLWIGMLLFGIFGVIRWLALDCSAIAPAVVPCDMASPVLPGLIRTVWWWLPVVMLGFGVLPPTIAYWLNLGERPRRDWTRWLPLVVWLVAIGCAIQGLRLPAVAPWSAAAIVVLLVAWAQQEVVQWRLPPRPRRRAADGKRVGDGSPATIVRNRLTHLLSVTLFGFAVTVLWVAIDSAAEYASEHAIPFGWTVIVLAPFLPLLRWGAVSRLKNRPALAPEGLRFQIPLGAFSFLLLFALVTFLDTLAHLVFLGSHRVAVWCVVTALLVSAVVGVTRAFLNLSSLQEAFAQKLVRTFLGASNDARVHPVGADVPVPVSTAHMEDDIQFDDYHPERAGGPLHLVGTCVNNTVDPLSGSQLRDDKGMPMCAGPFGLSVGRRFHALWAARTPHTPGRLTPVTPIQLDPDPHAFHVLARSDDKPAMVERLRLGQWMAISGAAYTTGTGRSTRLAQSLLLGLLNVRIGYWWNSGIPAGRRPGRYPPSLWQRLKTLPSTIFHMQSSLLNEWRAYFPGPARRLWYLSDGGHFDNTGLYELIRRRIPIMIAVDASHDSAYTFDDLALVTRQVRIDFGATITWLEPADIRNLFNPGQPPAPNGLPRWLANHINANAIGAFGDIGRKGPRGAALARVSYKDDPDRSSWLLLIKPCLLPNPPTDLKSYAAAHGAFPNQSTLDQFFDDNQWEAYRMLGLCAGQGVLKP